MFRFIESICCTRGKAQHLDLHQQRVNRTFQRFFPQTRMLNLDKIVEKIPTDIRYKCRVEYDAFGFDIDYIPYAKPTIDSLQVLVSDKINYDFKSADRDELTHLFNQRKEADDIMIVKNGQLTDSYFANLVFYDGVDWWTPKSPLLNGIKRQSLLDLGWIKERNIFVEDLGGFQTVSLINAMNDLGDLTVPVTEVKV